MSHQGPTSEYYDFTIQTLETKRENQNTQLCGKQLIDRTRGSCCARRESSSSSNLARSAPKKTLGTTEHYNYNVYYLLLCISHYKGGFVLGLIR